MKIEVREITREDAQAVNSLSQLLGYPLSVQQTLQNITAVLKSSDHTAFVAILEDNIVAGLVQRTPL